MQLNQPLNSRYFSCEGRDCHGAPENPLSAPLYSERYSALQGNRSHSLETFSLSPGNFCDRKMQERQELLTWFQAGGKEQCNKFKSVRMFFLLQVKITEWEIQGYFYWVSNCHCTINQYQACSKATLTGSCTIFRLYDILRMQSCKANITNILS